jgi:hypothetical protein
LQPLNRRTVVERYINQNRLAYFIAALKLPIQSGDSTPEIPSRKEQPDEASCRSSARQTRDYPCNWRLGASGTRFAQKVS